MDSRRSEIAHWKISTGILPVCAGRDHGSAFVLRYSQYDWKPTLLYFWVLGLQYSSSAVADRRQVYWSRCLKARPEVGFHLFDSIPRVERDVPARFVIPKMVKPCTWAIAGQSLS